MCDEIAATRKADVAKMSAASFGEVRSLCYSFVRITGQQIPRPRGDTRLERYGWLALKLEK